MDTVRWIIATAPEIFLLLAVAIGTVLGRIRIAGFSIGTTACTLIVAVIIGQLGAYATKGIPDLALGRSRSVSWVPPQGERQRPRLFVRLQGKTMFGVVVSRMAKVFKPKDRKSVV